MKDITTNIGVSVKYGKVNMTEKELDKIGEQIIKPYKEPVATKPKKQSTKEMFEKMTAFFFKNLCNCKK